jgi:hypothetical protein
MNKDAKPIFDWANSIGDANINNRILAKAMPVLVEMKIILTDSMIKEERNIIVPQKVYNVIKDNAESLLGAKYQGENQSCLI